MGRCNFSAAIADGSKLSEELQSVDGHTLTNASTHHFFFKGKHSSLRIVVSNVLHLQLSLFFSFFCLIMSEARPFCRWVSLDFNSTST